MRHMIGEASFQIIALILRAWGRRWISTTTSRVLTTAVVRATIWLLGPAPEQPSDVAEGRMP